MIIRGRAWIRWYRQAVSHFRMVTKHLFDIRKGKMITNCVKKVFSILVKGSFEVRCQRSSLIVTPLRLHHIIKASRSLEVTVGCSI